MSNIIKGGLDSPSPSPRIWVADGVDHINLQLSGATELGRKLSIPYNCNFDHPVLGPFVSMESLWQYINSSEQDDRLRVLSGSQLRSFSKELTKVRVDNFKAMIIDSYYHRVVNDERVLGLLMDSSLPIDCYYTNAGGRRIRRVFFKWFLYGLENIRYSLQTGVELDLYSLMDDPSVALYSNL